jgi:hypothetical protein
VRSPYDATGIQQGVASFHRCGSSDALDSDKILGPTIDILKCEWCGNEISTSWYWLGRHERRCPQLPTLESFGIGGTSKRPPGDQRRANKPEIDLSAED